MLRSDTAVTSRAAAMLHALGGRDNVLSVEHCMTRLRLRLRDAAAADEAGLRAAGAVGVLHRADGQMHVIIGVGVHALAQEMEKLVE